LQGFSLFGSLDPFPSLLTVSLFFGAKMANVLAKINPNLCLSILHRKPRLPQEKSAINSSGAKALGRENQQNFFTYAKPKNQEQRNYNK